MESDAEAKVTSRAIFKDRLWMDFLKYEILTVKKTVRMHHVWTQKGITDCREMNICDEKNNPTGM